MQKSEINYLILDPCVEMYQTCHEVVTCNGGLNNGLNTESSEVSIKGILTLS